MKIFQKGELKLLWPFYLETILSMLFCFAMAFFIVYLTNLGISMFQIGILSSVVGLTTILFEIPTGAVADIYGRKASVLLGLFIQGLGFLLIYFSSNFYHFIFIFAIIGFGATFCSGADQAWVTDLVKNKSGMMKSYFVKLQSLVGFCAIFSGLIGAWYVKNFGIRSAWLIAALSFLLSIIALSFAKENFKREKPHIKKALLNVKKQTLSSFSYAKKHSVLSYISLAALIAGFALEFNSALTWIPLLKERGLQDYMFGYWMSAMGVLGFIAPLLGGISKKGKEKTFIIISTILFILTTLFIIFVNSLVPLLAVFFISFFFAQMQIPIKGIYSQRFTPSKLRATISSTRSMLSSLVSIIALPIAGYLVDSIGPKNTIFLSAIFLLPVLLIYLKIKEPKQKS